MRTPSHRSISNHHVLMPMLVLAVAAIAQAAGGVPSDIAMSPATFSNDGRHLLARLAHRTGDISLQVRALDARGVGLPMWSGRTRLVPSFDGWCSLGVVKAREVLPIAVSVGGRTLWPVTIVVRDEHGHLTHRTIGGADIPPNTPPVAWPAETIAAGAWNEYSELATPLKDKSVPEGDCSRGATPNGETEIIRGDAPYFTSAFYGFDAVNNVFFYRIRVEAQPLTPGGQSGGTTGQDPWKNPTWNLMIDTDGDGFKEFNVVLDGGSGGGANRDISTTGTNDGDDLKIYYNNIRTQCVTAETVVANAVTVPGDLVWWGNAATQSVIPASPTSDGAAWDWGRTRVVYHTSANAMWGRGYLVDFQFPIAALTDAWNNGAGGNQLVGPNTPLAFGYTTSNSNIDPLQKDYASDYCYVPACDKAFPYADIVILGFGTTQPPVIGGMTLSSIVCPTSVTVSVMVADALTVEPPTSGTGVVTDTVVSVTFQFYADLDGDGKEDDGSVWTNMAVVGSSLNPDNRGDLAPNGITASFNDWGVVWNTSALANGQYLIRVTALDSQANSSTRITGAYIVDSGGQCREGIAASWDSYADSVHSIAQDEFQNNPPSTVYMSGLLTPTVTYKIAYYDSTGALISTDTQTADTFGNLASSLTVGPASPTGTYHSVVYPDTFTPPLTYNGVYDGATNPLRADDTFEVKPPPPPPIVDSPIFAGATVVTGTSTQPPGSTITVYVNGVPVGTTTVQPDGTWTLSGIGPLADGDVITANVTVGALISFPSDPVTVAGSPADVTPAPVVSSPIFAGATSISGTSVSPPGTVIDVYVNGVFVGTTTVLLGGTWTLTGVSPLADGDAINARATDVAAGLGTSAFSPTVYVSANAANDSDPPVVSAPLFSGDRVISGTSTEGPGTIIDVYVSGVHVGSTTVRPDGTWTLLNVGPLATGQVVTATATNLAAGEGTSAPSAPVIVEPIPPTVTSPLFAGATSVSGTSNEPAGSTITVYVNGSPVGTTTVLPGGTWTLTGLAPLADGDVVTATVTVGAQTSGPSAPVTVSAGPADASTPPVVSGPIFTGATSISGTSVEAPGTIITVYVDGDVVGTTTVLFDGTWILTDIGPLVAGQVVTATATNTAAGEGTSAPSAPVTVGPNPPVVDSPLLAGSPVVSGTSVEAPGSIITVYVNGSPVGLTIVQPDGTWILEGIPPLVDGDSVTATVTVGSQTSGPSAPVIVSANLANVSDPPVITGPLMSGDTSVSGTSTESPGTLIDVYVDGVWVGQTTVQLGGTWTLAGIPPLETGDTVTATATNVAAGEGTSGPSAPAVVMPTAPQVDSPILAGATTVTGTSLEPPGSTITVYVNGSPVGTTTVGADGTWTLSGIGPLVDGDVVTATVTVGTLTSALSSPVTVSANPTDVTPPPVVGSPIFAGATSISGTSVSTPGTLIDVYVNDVYVGTTTVLASGTWTLTGVDPLVDGDAINARATDVAAGFGTSALSNTVYVSANAANDSDPPVVSAPIYSGAMVISGTSNEDAGTIIDVFVDGVYVGTTTLRPDGTWLLMNVGPLATGQVVTATATNLGAGEGTSAPSAPVIVQPAPPTVDSPIFAGATSVSGTSNEPAGSTITVYVNGSPVGTTTVLADGTWTLSGLSPLADGDVVTATVTVGAQTSGPSAPVTVAAGPGDVSTPPVVSGPILSGETSISGTSVEPPGTIITVYVDGDIVGTTTVLPDGTWVVTDVGPLVTGQVVTATATNTAAGEGTSAPSAPVIVGPNPPVVRSPLFAGDTTVSGTSIEPPGSTITVYVNGIPVGTTIVEPDGTWTLQGIPPLVDGDSVTATVTVGSQTSGPSTPVIVSGNSLNISDPPVISGPLTTGDTSVTGTSTEPAGTLIDVYVDGVWVGQTTVQPGGTWALTGIESLDAGDTVWATATNVAGGEGTSEPSAPVIVLPDAPQVDSPILAGATTVTGISVEPPGSTITVYVNGVPVGTTVVASDGTWTLSGIGPLADGDVVTATVAVGPLVSPLSLPVIVAGGPGDVTPPPVVDDPIAALATMVTGTGLPGAFLIVYVDGAPVGSTTVTGAGTWSLSGLSPLPPGAVVTATQALAPGGTSTFSSPVVVGPLPSLLRNDELTSLSPPTPSLSTIFARVFTKPAPSLEPFGPDGVAEVGEGLLTQSPGSSDDDDYYMANLVSGTLDPDPTVLTDNGRVLVFYQIVDSDRTLYLSKSGSRILITFTP